MLLWGNIAVIISKAHWQFFNPRLTSSSLGLEVLDIARDGNEHAVVSLGCDADRGRDVGLDAQTLVGQGSVHGQVDCGERRDFLLVEIVNQGRVRVESGTSGVPKRRFIIIIMRSQSRVSKITQWALKKQQSDIKQQPDIKLRLQLTIQQ
jgi:hypothetical protein